MTGGWCYAASFSTNSGPLTLHGLLNYLPSQYGREEGGLWGSNSNKQMRKSLAVVYAATVALVRLSLSNWGICLFHSSYYALERKSIPSLPEKINKLPHSLWQ